MNIIRTACISMVFPLLVSVSAVLSQEKLPDPATPDPAPAKAETQNVPDYLDDRSTPEKLISSYYNAVNRKEYARAFSYYASDANATPFETFAAGYETTETVTVQFGKLVTEGAAGSTYWTLPLAIKSVATNGKETAFAGCYTIRLANPAVQGLPFVPMSIMQGTLTPSELPIDQSVPETCEAP